MVSGILAHKSKKERLKPLFFYARHFTSFGRLFFWPPQLAGLERAEMNRWPLRTSGYGGTFRTWRDVRLESVMRFKAEIGESGTPLLGSEIEPSPPDGVGGSGRLGGPLADRTAPAPPSPPITCPSFNLPAGSSRHSVLHGKTRPAEADFTTCVRRKAALVNVRYRIDICAL
jgi:hypothetical protein